MRRVLVRTGRAAVPRIVGDVHEELGAPAPVPARQIFEGRLVANHHAEAPQSIPVHGKAPAAPESAGPAPYAGHALHEPRGNKRHALDNRHEVVLLVDRISAPVARGIEVEGGVEIVVRPVGVILAVDPAGEDRRPALAREPGDARVPGRLQVAGDRYLRPDHERHRAARLERARHRDELRHHAIRVPRIPLLSEAFVRLDESHGAELADRERARAPGAIPPGGEDRGEHRERRTPLERPAPCSLLPAPGHRFHDHHVGPGEPQGHSPRARQVGPLHEHRGIRERAAQAEPGKANVALMAHRPFHRGPDDGKHDRQRHEGQAETHADDQPEEQRMPHAEEHDRREIAERRQRGEVPQRHHEPVEHGALGHEAIPEPPAQRAARVALAFEPTQQDDRRCDGEKAHDGETERGVAGGEESGAQRDQGRGLSGRRRHRSTSRPSSAER